MPYPLERSFPFLHLWVGNGKRRETKRETRAKLEPLHSVEQETRQTTPLETRGHLSLLMNVNPKKSIHYRIQANRPSWRKYRQ